MGEDPIKKEKEKTEKLFIDSNSWHKSQILRNYITAAAHAYTAKNRSIPPGSEFEDWMNWAIKQADEIDPLKRK